METTNEMTAAQIVTEFANHQLMQEEQIVALTEEIVRITEEKSELEALVERSQDTIRDLNQRFVNAVNRHQNDINTISSTLLDWTVENGVEDEYDSLLETLNNILNMRLDTRVRDFTVTQTYRVTRTITVSATDSDSALDAVDTASYLGDLDDGDWNVEDVDLMSNEAEEE